MSRILKYVFYLLYGALSVFLKYYLENSLGWTAVKAFVAVILLGVLCGIALAVYKALRKKKRP